VLVSAGFDAHADDPLGSMQITSAGFGALCARVQAIADRHANGKLILALEGGYNLAALRSSVRACLEVLAGGEPANISASASKQLGVLAELFATANQL
jgi:acetoin utilization deacetylase AcuC-like enzyme